jgi:SAM-dependent methyltransferase
MTQTKEYWKTRKADDKYNDWRTENTSWIQEYWETQNHPHRDQIVDALNIEFDSLLEIGCNCGPNIARIKKEYGNDKLYAGIDPNVSSLKFGRIMMPDVALIEGDIESLDIKDMKFDVVLADASLMYVDENNIFSVAEKISKLATKIIIICDWFDESIAGVEKDGHYARNYPKLFNKWKCTTKQINWPTSEKWKRNGRMFIFHRA